MRGEYIIYVGIIILITSGVISRQNDQNEENVKAGILGYIGGNKFPTREDLPRPEKDLKYTFILVKHGMVAPECVKAKTYPNDNNYKPHWEPGKVTKTGRSLMYMVGRSLNHRYKRFLKKIKSFEQIKVSSLSKEFAKRLTADLGIGLFDGTEHLKQLGIDLSWVTTNSNYEKMDKLMPLSRAECPWMRSLLEKMETEITTGHKYLARCTQNLYETLRGYVLVSDEIDKEWIMDLPAKVYKLWSMIVFEVLQGKKEPKWAKDEWSRIQSCVFEYHRTLLDYHPAIPAVMLGRMIKLMAEESSPTSSIKFHVHVTHELGVLAMNWTLPNAERTFWPDPGDALIFDFYTDDTIAVFSFSGLQRSFDKIYEGIEEELFLQYATKNTYLTQEEWLKLCAFDGMSRPPQDMDYNLFNIPLILKVAP